MAEIKVLGKNCQVTLSEPDEDGDYSWTAQCGEVADAFRPIDEAIANAENHVDCAWTVGNPEQHGAGRR